MKKLSTAINTTAISQSSASKPELDNSRLNRIFALMQANYGTRWVSQTGTGNALALSKSVWGRKLAGLTDEQIMTGLDNLPEDFPPTPMAFKKLCTAKPQGLLHNTAAYKPFDKSRVLEKKPDAKTAKDALSEIKKLLKTEH